MERIILTGFRGTGKTVVGLKLAKRLSVPFIDTDAHVEEMMGLSVSEIFKNFGEEVFRKAESEVIAGLPEYSSVVSTGGGAVMDPVNVRNFRAGSTVFMLCTTLDLIEERISGSERPSLTVFPLHDEILVLLRERMPAYISSADYCIDTDTLSVDEVSAKIINILKNGLAGSEERKSGLDFMRQISLPAPESETVERLLTEPDSPPLRLCGIAGNPCFHSKSPGIYNRLFEEYRLNFHYTWFQYEDAGEIIRHARAMDVRGISVTIPHKQAVIPYLDSIDAHAEAIGAVNTVLHCGGKMYGSNTDWIGVRRPLEGHEGEVGVVFGAGGAAMGAVYAMKDLGMDVTVLNRNEDRAAEVAERFGCSSGALNDFGSLSPDVVVNATPVGMGKNGGSILTRDQLRESMTVFDLVYTPPKTPLLILAGAAGCTCISGEEMFVHQLCEQFRIFTGIEVEPGHVREMMK
ncbi:MAG: shikimate kinase [Euryarchaeota archaeon]|nr:shikimate kinase [Euryarchaeota archaeon]